MARSENQKLKLLYEMQYLLRETDREHTVSTQDIIDMLADNGISAERKSIADDLRALEDFGLRIQHTRGKICITDRDFESGELKLLVDSVQSSHFIPADKTYELIKKIEFLTSKYEGQLLQRQVYVRNRVKTMSDSVFSNVDIISNAINSNSVIRFRYFEFNTLKRRQYRHDGAFYEQSPYALVYVDQNYYMLAYDAKLDAIKHYRVDKMTDILPLKKPREGKEVFAKADMSTYTNKVFAMFTGEEQRVRLKFANHLLDAVIDRFGKDIIVVPSGDNHFTVTLDIVVSTQFYAWLFAFDTDVEILFPESVRQGMQEQAKRVLLKYGAKI